jgi:hypothetical protein
MTNVVSPYAASRSDRGPIARTVSARATRQNYEGIEWTRPSLSVTALSSNPIRHVEQA